MKYNMNTLARTYLKGYYKFLTKHTTIRKATTAHTLFLYSIKTLYGLEVSEYSKEVDKYGDNCVLFLKNLEGTPRHPEKCSFEDKVTLVNYCDMYIVITDLLSNKTIKEGVIEKVKVYKDS